MLLLDCLGILRHLWIFHDTISPTACALKRLKIIQYILYLISFISYYLYYLNNFKKSIFLVYIDR